MTPDQCETIRILAQDFFAGRLQIEAKDRVLTHLHKCVRCYNYYLEYAGKRGIVFDLTRETIKLYCSYDSLEDFDDKQKEKAKDDLNSVTKVEDYIKDKWTMAANREAFDELMNLKCVRDCVQEDKHLANDEKNSENNRAFRLYLINKFCKRIDHLETCLRMEAGVKKL